MKFIHLSDLHLGKRVNGFSMIEDQQYILTKILNIIDDEKPDGVIIAGDVYDKSIPSTDAVSLFDDFLVKLSRRNLEIFVISGNHDSPERIAFASRIMDSKGIHLSPVYNGEIKPITMKDQYGELDVYMLPFIKPFQIRQIFEDESITSYTDAIDSAVQKMNVDTQKRTVLVTHQFVTGAHTSESEEISVGGTDNVDASVFDPFDYVALGHIHGPQHVSRDTLRYCGTPLKYSISEENHKKSVTVVEMKGKGSIQIRTVELIPIRDMRTIKGAYSEVMSRDFYKDTNTDDYIYMVLTDEDDIPDAINKLRTVYKNIMHLDYDNERTRNKRKITRSIDTKDMSPLELFAAFYEEQNNQPMSEEQYAYINSLIEKITEGSLCDL